MKWFKRERYTLLVMRLADMQVVHPEMDESKCCSRCGEPVGIYPSGQAALQRYGKRMDLVCHVCLPPKAEFQPAPGALEEFGQGVRRS